jgi:magnesium chelatase family protein
MSSKIYSVELSGLDGHLVEIEVDNRPHGKPCFSIIGLPDTAVQEAHERVISAVKNSGFKFPRGRVIANLAPADLKKMGSRYDLAIAIGAIRLSEDIPDNRISETIFLGELSLNGEVRPVNGVLASVEFAKKRGFKQVMTPMENAGEAALVPDIKIIPLKHLKEAVLYLYDELCALPVKPPTKQTTLIKAVDMSSIKGQAQAKRALEIAAAGGHNIIFNGAPGAGKTFMARALIGILPDMTHDEMIEVTKIYSIAGLLPRTQPLITLRPFRPVHHTASAVSIVGGGNIPGPGEITLAHRGVLFLDEIAEFPSHVLEVLRQPMEDRRITVSRAKATITYPAEFTLVAAMNPCPCGYYGIENSSRICSCPAWKIQRYQKKLSGPLLDRIDLHLSIQPVEYHKLIGGDAGETSEQIKKRIEEAAQIQRERFKDLPIRKNSEMDNGSLQKFCKLDQKCTSLLEKAMNRFELSARAYFRIIKLSRTIADLEKSDNITSAHVSEALQYRIRN